MDLIKPYSTNYRLSKGRLFSEKESISRSPFMRDRDRLIHSAAFRRLEHKTQVFVHHEGDNFRSRLTHTIEVAQIARTISKQLRLDQDLSETVALAHDLGHTPFGHAGEEALASVMLSHGGFDHNAQTLRIVTKLERKYAGFDGLNLTWESLEGIVKHNGPLKTKVPYAISEYQAYIKSINKNHDLILKEYSGPEAQVAAIADDIAYCNHDIDDGIRAGLFNINELSSIPHIDQIIFNIRKQWNKIEHRRLVHETIRKLISNMIKDVVHETRMKFKAGKFKNVQEIRSLKYPIISFSKKIYNENELLRQFLHEKMYKHTIVNRMTIKAKRIVRDLFSAFSSDFSILPIEWREIVKNSSKKESYRIIADYIAGMTDRYAIMEHKRLFDLHGGWAGTSLYDKRDR